MDTPKELCLLHLSLEAVFYSCYQGTGSIRRLVSTRICTSSMLPSQFVSTDESKSKSTTTIWILERRNFGRALVAHKMCSWILCTPRLSCAVYKSSAHLIRVSITRSDISLFELASLCSFSQGHRGLGYDGKCALENDDDDDQQRRIIKRLESRTGFDWSMLWPQLVLTTRIIIVILCRLTRHPIPDKRMRGCPRGHEWWQRYFVLLLHSRVDQLANLYTADHTPAERRRLSPPRGKIFDQNALSHSSSRTTGLDRLGYKTVRVVTDVLDKRLLHESSRRGGLGSPGDVYLVSTVMSGITTVMIPISMSVYVCLKTSPAVTLAAFQSASSVRSVLRWICAPADLLKHLILLYYSQATSLSTWAPCFPTSCRIVGASTPWTGCRSHQAFRHGPCRLA